jgi:uracil-DNA glycosylase
MKRTLYFSGAAVIVCMGNVARRALHLAQGKNDDLADFPGQAGEVQAREWEIERQGGASKVLVLFLRHPSAFGKMQKLGAGKEISDPFTQAKRRLAAALL